MIFDTLLASRRSTSTVKLKAYVKVVARNTSLLLTSQNKENYRS